jgi:transcriptional regulator with XRE-family HTH domain
MTTGEKVRQARDSLGLTQKELGAKLDRDAITVSRWERNESFPSLQALRRLAIMSSVPVDWFFDDEGGEDGSR